LRVHTLAMTDVALRPGLVWKAQTEARTDNAIRPGVRQRGPTTALRDPKQTKPDPVTDAATDTMRAGYLPQYEGGASLPMVVRGYDCKSHGTVPLCCGSHMGGHLCLAFGTLLVMGCHLCNALLFLCAVFLCLRPFLGGPRQEFFP
jgi:hypothetical protein